MMIVRLCLFASLKAVMRTDVDAKHPAKSGRKPFCIYPGKLLFFLQNAINRQAIIAQSIFRSTFKHAIGRKLETSERRSGFFTIREIHAIPKSRGNSPDFSTWQRISYRIVAQHVICLYAMYGIPFGPGA